MTSTQFDLRELALERTTNRPQSGGNRKLHVGRYLIPAGVILGFIALLIVAVSDQFLPRQEVTVVPVIVKRAEIQQAGTPLFQAAGWVEPRPTPVNVAALTEGVVQELLVVEGQRIEAGEPVARLIDVDLQLQLRQVESTLKLRQAELQSSQAELKAAQLKRDNPVHLEAALADAKSLLAKTKTILAKLPFQIQSAEGRALYAKQNYEGKKSAEGAVAGRLIQEAFSELTNASAELAELNQREPYLQREVETLEQKVKALSTQLNLLIEESRQLEDAQAKLKVAQARVADAELAVEKVQLYLERTTVRSPIDGCVLKLISAPGSRVMGLQSSAGQSSSTVVSMYDPNKLQVRADVRLEDVPLVQPGQPVEIETASSKELIQGIVLLPTSSANVQKNTLEVKVAIDHPPATIRPEMLVTATFLAPPKPSSEKDESQESARLLVPRSLILNEEGTTSIWIVTADQTAEKRAITLGKAGTEELIEVSVGLTPTDKLIASGQQGLDTGMAVTITGEEPGLGE